MLDNVRDGETIGSLDARVFALEQSLINRWDRWFGKHPGVILGVVITSLTAGGWIYHTWQMDRVTKEYESRISWLKEQAGLELKNQKDRCDVEKKHLENSLSVCKNNASGSLKATSKDGGS